MKITQFYPLLQVEDVKTTAAFFQEHFDFAPAFEADWYVHLQSNSNPATNIAVLQMDHDTIPEGFRGPTQGMILSFEVEDVDEIHTAFAKAGIEILHALRDEPHGQRHFIAKAPGDILIDVIKPIPPSEEFLAQYREDAVPT